MIMMIVIKDSIYTQQHFYQTFKVYYFATLELVDLEVLQVHQACIIIWRIIIEDESDIDDDGNIWQTLI